MAKKVPVVIYVDPDKETQFSIKPFAAGLAIQPQAAAQLVPEDASNTASATATVSNDVDADMDMD